MPAKTKSDLLRVTATEWDKLCTLLETVEAPLAMQPDAEGITIKDIIGHRAHWITLFFGWYADGQAGKDVQFPAPGHKWSDLPAYNAALRKSQTDLGWQDVTEMLKDAHAQLVSFLTNLDEDSLYGAPMKGAKNAWTTGRWAEAAGPSHYRSAAKYIRARLRSS